MRLTPSQKMLALLREKFKLQIPWDAKVDRVRAGYWQRAGGAFSWMIMAEGFGGIGSQTSITDLLRCPNLEVNESHGDRTVYCGCSGGCVGLKKKVKP